MPTAEQLSVLADIEADGKRVTLIPPRAGVDFVSGGKGSASGLPNVQTWMLPLQYSSNKIDHSTILARDSRMMLGAAAFTDDQVPGPGWAALVRVLADVDFPAAGDPGVQRFEVVKLDDVTYEDGGGGAPLLYYLQVRT